MDLTNKVLSGNEDEQCIAELDRDPVTGETIVYVCHGRMCGRHAKYIMERIEQVRAKGVKVRPQKCTCMGQCENAPNVRIKKKIHSRMNPIKVADIAKRSA